MEILCNKCHEYFNTAQGATEQRCDWNIYVQQKLSIILFTWIVTSFHEEESRLAKDAFLVFLQLQ